MKSFSVKVLIIVSVIFLGFASPQSRALTEADEPAYYGTSIYFHDWNGAEHIREGYDWSMPDWVEPDPISAVTHSRRFYGIPGIADDTPGDQLLKDAGFRGNIKRQVSWNWKRIEPSEGNYDFDSLRQEIDRQSEGGKFKIELRVYAAVLTYERFFDDGTPREFEPGYWAETKDIEESAPRWLAENYDIARLVQKKFRNHRLTLLDEYDGRYHYRYIKMVKALAESGVLNHPDIMNVYIHQGSETRGEEGMGPELGIANRALYEERIKTWADAMGDRRNRLMITSNKSDDLQFAYSNGVGQRNGFVENFLMHVSNPDLGTYVDSAGYLEVDEQHPLIKNGLASGDENEEYFFTELMRDRFGEFEAFRQRYIDSSLRILQMRRTSIYDQNAQGFINPPLQQFVALSLAKDVTNTADAWTYLRQNNLQLNNPNNANVQDQIDINNRNSDGTLPVKNFERWLYQRDGGDIQTVPTRDVGYGGKQLFRDSAYSFEYTARRTEIASGDDKIGLALDDRFIFGSGESVAIKVTYIDQGNGQWYLQYKDANGDVQTRTVKNEDSGKLLTKTWILDDIAFDAENRDNDFFLIASTVDLTASFVRVVKMNKPAAVARAELRAER